MQMSLEQKALFGGYFGFIWEVFVLIGILFGQVFVLYYLQLYSMIMKRLVSLVFAAAFFMGSCGETKSTEEKREIEIMDSTEKEVKKATENLKDQTEKLEKSLEKLDKEFTDSTD